MRTIHRDNTLQVEATEEGAMRFVDRDSSEDVATADTMVLSALSAYLSGNEQQFVRRGSFDERIDHRIISSPSDSAIILDHPGSSPLPEDYSGDAGESYIAQDEVVVSASKMVDVVMKYMYLAGVGDVGGDSFVFDWPGSGGYTARFELEDVPEEDEEEEDVTETWDDIEAPDEEWLRKHVNFREAEAR